MPGETFIGAPWRQPYTAKQLADAAANQVPIIGNNGNFWKWDIESGQFVDTGVAAGAGLADGQVTTPKLADGAVDWSKIAPEARRINDNLLVNAYFIGGGSQQGGGQFPVNQRGLVEYTYAAGYFIDRWKRDSGMLVTLTAAGLELWRSSAGDNAILQLMECWRDLVGRQLTLSFLAQGTAGTRALLGYFVGSGSIYDNWVPMTGDLQLITYTFTVPSTATNLGIIIRASVSDNFANEVVTLKAAKLELGPYQTLAHQDADGNWILNDPPPKFGAELAECQRYFYDELDGFLVFCWTSGANQVWTFIGQFPTTMRAKPATKTNEAISVNVLGTNNYTKTVTASTIGFTSNGGEYMIIPGSQGLDSEKVYHCVVNNIDANL